MMLISVTGNLGTGKTLFLSLLGKVSEGEIPIYGNYSLNLDKYTEIDVEDLESIQGGLLLIDEAYQWLESRVSSSELNRYLSRFVFKSRKKGFDIVMSSQLESSIDLRARHLKDLRVHALGLTEMKDGRDAYKYVFAGWGKMKKFYLLETTAEQIYPIFDTLEYPEEEPSKFEPQRYSERVDELVEMIEEFYDFEDLTKGMLKDFLIERGVNESSLIDGVYNRMKRRAVEVEA